MGTSNLKFVFAVLLLCLHFIFLKPSVSIPPFAIHLFRVIDVLLHKEAVDFFEYNIITITMAQQLYMGSGLLFPRLLGRAHLWQLVTGQLAALLFYRS